MANTQHINSFVHTDIEQAVKELEFRKYDPTISQFVSRNLPIGGLYIDYGLGSSFPGFKLGCKCKSKNCRKTITGNDWLNDDFVEKNKDYFLRELLAERKKLIQKANLLKIKC